MGDMVAGVVLLDDEFEIEIVSINFQFANFVSQSISNCFSRNSRRDESPATRSPAQRRATNAAIHTGKSAETRQFLQLLPIGRSVCAEPRTATKSPRVHNNREVSNSRPAAVRVNI
jgi:hypothetical protein